jgi:hypothetical protein
MRQSKREDALRRRSRAKRWCSGTLHWKRHNCTAMTFRADRPPPSFGAAPGSAVPGHSLRHTGEGGLRF